MTAQPVTPGVDPEAYAMRVLAERSDLLDRINDGDSDAIVELFETMLPGAKVGPVTSYPRAADA